MSYTATQKSSAANRHSISRNNHDSAPSSATPHWQQNGRSEKSIPAQTSSTAETQRGSATPPMNTVDTQSVGSWQSSSGTVTRRHDHPGQAAFTENLNTPGPVNIYPEGVPLNGEGINAVGATIIQPTRDYNEDYNRFLDGNEVFKIFSKHAKEKVAAINTLKASARRRNPATFKCSIDGCGADFTRKHNLENHLKSHCGVTDRVCSVCGKGFTTIPVWKRHQKSCEKSASSNKAAGTSNGFLDAMTAQRHA